MANIHQSITELIGNTPLLQLNRYTAKRGIKATILAKLEYFNPIGSAKDRIVWSMIEAALKSGELTAESTIVEVTSGNTGIAEAVIAASVGLPATILLASNTSPERRALLRAFGAKIVSIPDVSGQEAIDALMATAAETPNAWVPSQFTNQNNPRIHRATTGPEIYRDTDGDVDFFVAGLGTGGTISGSGEFLKSVLPEIKVIGVEPGDEASLSELWKCRCTRNRPTCQHSSRPSWTRGKRLDWRGTYSSRRAASSKA